MRKADLTRLALRAIASAKKGEPFEDSHVEFKRQLREPEDAAKQIAGMANAASGEEIILIIGVDEKGNVWEVPQEELADWYPQVKKHFDGPAPRLLKNLNLTIDEKTIAVFYFKCSDVPYLFKRGSSRDIPWREGNGTRSATREELFRMFAEGGTSTQLPDVDYLSGSFRGEFGVNGELARILLYVDLYVKTKGESIVIPRHDCKAFVVAGRQRAAFDKVYLIRSKTEGGEFPADLTFERPGPLILIATTDSPRSFPQGAVTLHIRLRPVNAKDAIRIKRRTTIELPDQPPKPPKKEEGTNPWWLTPL